MFDPLLEAFPKLIEISSIPMAISEASTAQPLPTEQIISQLPVDDSASSIRGTTTVSERRRFMLDHQHPLRQIRGDIFTPNLYNNTVPPVRLFLDPETVSKSTDDEYTQTIGDLIELSRMPTIEGVRSMPDFHPGTTIPIGTVVAMEEDGLVCPSMIGGDIGCGVRVELTNLDASMFSGEDLQRIVDSLGRSTQTGFRITSLRDTLVHGMKWATRSRLSTNSDVLSVWDGSVSKPVNTNCLLQTYDHLDGRGLLDGAVACMGTIGGGNHFVELQVVDEIMQASAAHLFGLQKGQLIFMIHSGSRKLGNNIGRYFDKQLRKAKDRPEDMPYAATPANSELGKQYMAANSLTRNYAVINRLLLSHRLQKAVRSITERRSIPFSTRPLIDISHNTITTERFDGDKAGRRLIIHRKGAAPARPPRDAVLPARWQETGLPTPIPGDMGSESYIVVGGPNVLTESYGSVSHGAGRRIKRSEVEGQIDMGVFRAQMEGIPTSLPLEQLIDEAPDAYKNVGDVVGVLRRTGLAEPVVRLKPLANVKQGRG